MRLVLDVQRGFLLTQSVSIIISLGMKNGINIYLFIRKEMYKPQALSFIHNLLLYFAKGNKFREIIT